MSILAFALSLPAATIPAESVPEPTPDPFQERREAMVREDIARSGWSRTGVKDKVVDLGFTSWGFFPDEYLVLLPAGGPNKFHYESAPAILQAWLQLYEEFPQYPAVFKAKNQKLLFHVAFASNELVSRKPINSLEDLKGMKSRAGGKYEPKIMEAAGCSSVRTRTAEAYDALQKGMIDVCLTSYPLVKQYKFFEIAKYVSVLGAGPTDAVAACTINQQSYDKLPKDLQDVLTQVSDEHFKVWSKMTYDFMDEAEKFMRAQGMTINPVDEFQDSFDITRFSTSIYQAIKDIINPLRSNPTRGALST